MADGLFLGIDGGGTSSRARLVDGSGRILGEGHAGSSNLTLGTDIAAGSIRRAADAAFTAAGISPDRMAETRAGFGLAGANVPSLVDALQAAPFPFRSVAIASDAVAACLGAHGGEDGAILVLGTGSQGLALVGGKATAVGGWGFAVGDEGSGAILGRAAIRAAILAVDGLAPASDLTEAIMGRFAGDPAAAVVWARTAAPRDYGSFAPLVLDFDRKGDPVATKLMQASAASVMVMLDRLAELGATRIALMGGMAAPHRPLLDPRFDALLVEPRGDAMDGALALARRDAAP